MWDYLFSYGVEKLRDVPATDVGWLWSRKNLLEAYKDNLNELSQSSQAVSARFLTYDVNEVVNNAKEIIFKGLISICPLN